MTTTLHPIPDAALESDIAILGKKGRGKSYTARGLVERLLDMGRQVVVLDPLSTWWGLKAGPRGYPIPVLGGPHADLPLDAAAGEALGRFLAASDQSAVLDLGEFRKAEMVRFATSFLEELYAGNRKPLWLVLEEADVFAPQQPMPETARLLGEVDRIARRGRQFGFKLISLTQRPARLNKDVLTQLSTLVALGLTSPQDRDAIKAWVEGAGDRDKSKEVLASLASLKVGEGWVWAPDHDILERVTFPKIKTPDTSATPKAGEVRKVSAVRKDVDVAALRAALVAEGAGQPNPKTAAICQPKASEAEIAEAERRGEARGYRAGVSAAANHVAAFTLEWKAGAPGSAKFETVDRHPVGKAFADAILDLLEKTSGDGADIPQKPAEKYNRKYSSRPTTAIPAPVPKPNGHTRPSGDLTPALQRVLDALGWWRAAGHAAVPRARACVVAGYSPKASTFGVYIGDLVKRGLVATGSGVVGLTDAGLAAANLPKLASREDARAAGRELLKPQEARVFDVVYEAHPDAIRRDDVAKAVGLSPTASTVGVYIGAVAGFGLIETAGRGEVRASDWLFEVGV